MDVTVRNNSNSEGTDKASLVPSFELIDGTAELTKGRLNLPGRGEPEVQRYSQSLRQYPAYPTFPDLLTMLNPGMTMRGSVIFDVPQNRQYALYFEGGYKSDKSAIVPIFGQPAAPSVSEPPAISQEPVNTTPPGPSPSQPSTSASPPAPPVATMKPTSGVLCNGTIDVPQYGELVFKNLPGDRLKFTFDHDAWRPTVRRQPDGMQTLVMQSIRPGIQTKCDITWETMPPPAAPPASGGPQSNGTSVVASRPILLSKVEPEYSEDARRAKFNGAVRASITIDERGNVTSVTVLDSPGLGLDEKIIAAVRKWRFKPAMKDGVPVATNGAVTLTFRNF